MNLYLERATELEGQIIEDRRHIHQNPEVGSDLPLTHAYIMKRLQEKGISARRCGGSGVVAEIGKPDGKTILLRADIDALPMPEESGLPFASPYPDRSHACGHDCHGAMLLGAAQMLKENEEKLNGRVRLMFQPNEENLYGSLEMIEDGVLDGVDAALGAHVDATMPLDYLIRGIGNTFASNDIFKIVIQGKAAHSGRPHDSVDAIAILAQIINGLQILISREANAVETNVISIASVKAGGETFTIIPGEAELVGCLRCYSNDQRMLLKQRLEEMTAGVAAAYRGTAEVIYAREGIPPVHCDEAMADDLIRYSDQLFGQDHTVKETFKKVGADDYAYITQRIPSGYFFLGAGPDAEKGWPYGQHNPKVKHNEAVLKKGAALLAYCADCWLRDHG